MEPYTEQELDQMRAAFNTIEMAYIMMDESSFQPDTKEHRRLNKTLVDELAKKEPDHEKIYYLLEAINTVQNGKQQTTTAFPSEEEPESEKTTGIKGWFKKVRQAWKQAGQSNSALPE